MKSARIAQPTRELWRVFGPTAVLATIGFAVAYQFVDPAPPRSITLTTGRQDGAYYQFGLRYAEILDRAGIELTLVESAGSQENITALQLPDSEVDIAVIQGGTPADPDGAKLAALGSLFFEPLWIFFRQPAEYTRLPQLDGLHVAIGPVGSGTRTVMMQLLADNGLVDVTLSPLSGMDAAEALSAGEVDVVAQVASAQSPAVQRLLRDPEITLMSFARAQAYARIHPFLSTVVLPEGVVDLQRNIPAADTMLVATTAGFVVDERFHPALSDLMLQAATEVHGHGGLFERPDEFPSDHYVEFPLSKEARRYYKYGPPLLQRYMPFWAATLIDRLKIMLLPLLALALPLFRLMPPIYRWRIRSRIYKWYRDIDQLFDTSLGVGGDRAEGLARLDAIEAEVAQTSIPLSYHQELYNLHLHIDYVRKHITK